MSVARTGVVPQMENVTTSHMKVPLFWYMTVMLVSDDEGEESVYQVTHHHYVRLDKEY